VQIWLTTLGFGVIDAAVLAVAAVGFTLQFGVTNYVNFAYGELITFGAFMALMAGGHPFGLPIWQSLIVAALLTGVLSFVVGRFVFTPFFQRRPQLLFALATTFAASLILSSIWAAVWGAQYQELNYGGADVHSVGPFIATTAELLFVVVAAAALLGVHLLLTQTKLGRTMRAMADDRNLAIACGLNIRRTTNLTWLITGLLAGVAGVIQAMQVHTFNTNIGSTYVFLIITAAVLGGIGRPYGAVIGAVIIGVASQLAVLVVGAALSPVVVFVILVFLMVARPTGIFGATGRTTAFGSA
jgi:branched-subunit amino acid ABC-type transport system permease component